MQIISVNSNIIDVPTVQNGCLQAEFDSTYPVRLHNIITQDEFQQSIANINQVFSATKSSNRRLLLCLLSIIAGLGTLVMGLHTPKKMPSTTGSTTNGPFATMTTSVMTNLSNGDRPRSSFEKKGSDTHEFTLLAGIGVAIVVFGILAIFFEVAYIQNRHIARVKQVVAKESMKYSIRYPIPCSWTLMVTWVPLNGYSRRHQRVFQLRIEIGYALAAQYGTGTWQPIQPIASPLQVHFQQNQTPEYDVNHSGL